MKLLVGIAFGFLCALFLLPFIFFEQKKVALGTNLASPACTVGEVRLLLDRTFLDPISKERISRQVIFDTLLDEIRTADRYLILDFFLWNDWTIGLHSNEQMRPLAQELLKALQEKKKQDPQMPILFITDPINRFYSKGDLIQDKAWRDLGIPIVFTDLSYLPESNRIYVPLVQFWARLFSWFNLGDYRLPFANPLQPKASPFTLGQWNQLLHFKANHRKVLIAGRSSEPARMMVSSLNPSDGSARNSNAGLLVTGALARYAARSEIEIARWSIENANNCTTLSREAMIKLLNKLESHIPELEFQELAEAKGPSILWLSEGAIHKAYLDAIDSSVKGDAIDLALFYLSDRAIIKALIKAANRGVRIRCLLDLNHDAFGRQKSGIPNHPVAAELHNALDETAEGSIEIRWAVTHGEQFHAKVFRLRGTHVDLLSMGSANWTRRNLANNNLEANVLLHNARTVGAQWDHYFNSIWRNTNGANESKAYEENAIRGWRLFWQTWLYRFQEWSGLSTF
jgi:phosphatidylserine/phosphatidylglycerophosphate/cardiolipin synthase-like enzyme